MRFSPARTQPSFHFCKPGSVRGRAIWRYCSVLYMPSSVVFSPIFQSLTCTESTAYRFMATVMPNWYRTARYTPDDRRKSVSDTVNFFWKKAKRDVAAGMMLVRAHHHVSVKSPTIQVSGTSPLTR